MIEVNFPKRLFRWFLSRQILLAAFLLILLETLLFFVFSLRGDLPEESRQVVKEVLLWSLLSSFIVMVGVSLVMARQLVGPLGRLITKTQRLAQYPFNEENLSREDLTSEEVGEWYDLERALDRLGLDLRQKTIRLSREKTELRTIMSAISEAVIAVDHEKRPLFYNSQFALFFNLEAGGRSDSHFLSEIIRSPDILQACEKSLQVGSSEKVEVQLDLNGRTHDFSVSVTPLRKKHNSEIYGSAMVFHDITELKKAERIRIEFVGNVSHELRTPLTSIKGYLQTVRQDFAEGRFEMMGEFLEIIGKNVDRLILLVGDLLDLSSLESGSSLSHAKVRTREVSEAVLNQVNTRDHQVKVSYQVEEVDGEASRIEQVLRNLLQNAVRYVPKGRLIEIEWVNSVSGGVELHVRDDGPGIPKEHLDRLFERFYRVDEARSRELGGTGIGLSLVKHIMQRHGGSVRVFSDLGRGAEFVCEFPRQNHRRGSSTEVHGDSNRSI